MFPLWMSLKQIQSLPSPNKSIFCSSPFPLPQYCLSNGPHHHLPFQPVRKKFKKHSGFSPFLVPHSVEPRAVWFSHLEHPMARTSLSFCYWCPLALRTTPSCFSDLRMLKDVKASENIGMEVEGIKMKKLDACLICAWTPYPVFLSWAFRAIPCLSTRSIGVDHSLCRLSELTLLSLHHVSRSSTSFPFHMLCCHLVPCARHGNKCSGEGRGDLTLSSGNLLILHVKLQN